LLKRRPHFEQCPEITMPLASLLTTYILGLSAIPTVSHSSDPIDTPVDFKLHHYQFVQYIETHHVLEEYKRLSFFWLSSLTWGKSNPHPVLPSWVPLSGCSHFPLSARLPQWRCAES